MPRISVVMSAYNSEKYIKEAIDSILSQTYEDFEYIIINDGSTDKTEEIIQSYNDDRIVYVNNEENIGLTKSLNKGIKMAKGEYIARMDADDISLPHRFQKQVDFMDANHDVGVVGSWMECFGDVNRIVKIPTEHEDLFYSFLHTYPTIPHPTAFIRKAILFGNNIFYDESVKYAQDFKLWNELKYVTRLSNMPEVLLLYRVNSCSISSLNKEEQNNIRYQVVKGSFEKCFNHEYVYDDIVNRKNYSYDNMICFLSVIRKYKNRRYKYNVIKRFLRKNMSKRYDIVNFIKYFKIKMLIYIIYG